MITEETMEKILLLDCSKEISIRRLKKSLIKLLPFIKKESDYSTDKLESFVLKIETKKIICLGYIMRNTHNKKAHYTGMIKTYNDHTWLKSIYGLDIWEVLAKTLIYMYYHIEKNKK